MRAVWLLAVAGVAASGCFAPLGANGPTPVQEVVCDDLTAPFSAEGGGVLLGIVPLEDHSHFRANITARNCGDQTYWRTGSSSNCEAMLGWHVLGPDGEPLRPGPRICTAAMVRTSLPPGEEISNQIAWDRTEWVEDEEGHGEHRRVAPGDYTIVASVLASTQEPEGYESLPLTEVVTLSVPLHVS